MEVIAKSGGSSTERRRTGEGSGAAVQGNGEGYAAMKSAMILTASVAVASTQMMHHAA